jgi:serine protease AprX
MDVHGAFPDTEGMTGVGSPNISRRLLVGLVAIMLVALSTTLPTQRPAGSSPAAAAVHATAAVDDALRAVHHGAVRIIVQKDASAATATTTAGAVERAITRLGGKITLDLPIVNGFAATVPADSIPALAETPGVRAISLDRKMTVQGTGSGGTVKSIYRKTVRADDLNTAGYTGRGITVALIDTGVAPVADLAGRILPVTDDITGAVTPCENLSGESTCDDSYGHGTFVAGIIAGSGASSQGAYKGVAPEANIVSVKIAGRSGAADVSAVLAGIQWVVSFRDRYGIKVLNLSLGTDSTQSYRVDPLNYAVEKAWQSGISVVVSASNRGPDPRTISKPGDDPFVITVGAVDDRGTSATSDDTLPNFASRGPTAADNLPKPDVTAPGAHVVSLRAPGSAIDEIFPNYIDGSYRKGSGTSFAAGVVSGTAALISQASPLATPDRVKYALMSTARKVASSDPSAVGTGEIDAVSAALSAPPGLANQGVTPGNGTGLLDLSRGTVQVQTNDPMQTVVNGTLTAQLLLWDPLSLFVAWNGASWYGASWYGASWYGASWYGASWYGASWYGASWYGASWYGQTDGASWYGASWYGASWYGAWE